MSSRLDALNRWLVVVSNLGVIGGFALLAVQMNQNTRAIQIESSRALMRETQPTEVAFMGDDVAGAYAIAVLRPADLTPHQLLQVWGYVSAGLAPSRAAWVAWRDGQGSEESWLLARASAAAYIDLRVGRLIWSEIKAGYPPEFVAEIDQQLALVEPGVNDRALARVLQGVGKLPPLLPAAEVAGDAESLR